jgi:chaperone required for assembly of F1-ATPase
MGADMSGWTRKRFWKETSVSQADAGFCVLLDGRAIKTPAKSALIVPTHALAQMIAAEWDAQSDTVNPETMPATRAANSAIDKVRGQFDDVARLVAAYGETDLLCYRASAPRELVARQAEAWDPLLDWCARRYGVTWTVTQGVMPCPQPPATGARLGGAIAEMTPWELTGFHDLVAMSGSLVIGLAAYSGEFDPEALWMCSRIDEVWQTEHWGADDEAAALAAARRESFLQAARFLAALKDTAQ